MDTPPPDVPDPLRSAHIHPHAHAPDGLDAPDALETGAAYDVLGSLYDAWVQSVVEDIPFYCRVVTDSGESARVLELGAGSGRITLPLLARGHHVTAVDVAGVQLDLLQSVATRNGTDSRLRVEHADLRDALAGHADSEFDAIIAPFRCLLHVAHDAESIMVDAARVLRPGGVLAFDVFHPPPGTESSLAASWQLRRRVDMPDGAWSIWERASADASQDALRLDVRCDGPGGVSRISSMTLHTPPPHHWRDAVEAAGLHLVSAWSWFDGAPFELSAPDSVWLARRPHG